MRIMLISGSAPPMKCGVGDYTLRLAMALVEHFRAEVAVLTSVGADACPPSQCTDKSLQILPLIKNWSFRELPHIFRVVVDWDPDVVHIQYPTKGYCRFMMPSFLPFFLRWRGIAVLQTWHEPLSWKGLFRYLPNVFTRDTLIVVEPEYCSMLPFWYQQIIHRKRVQFIPISSNIPRVVITESKRNFLRSKFDALDAKIIVYFGFVNLNKGVDKLFEIADPNYDRLVLICELNNRNFDHKKILEHILSQKWRDKVFVTGYLDAEIVGETLAVADAILLPFLNGVMVRNGSFLAAIEQGVFTLTTHRTKHGYSPEENVYYAHPSDMGDMRAKLRKYIGKKKEMDRKHWDWHSIADAHMLCYKRILEY